VEDSATDVFVIGEVLNQCGFAFDLLVLPDGDVALDCIRALQQKPDAKLPAVILLDLNLPKVNGFEVLAALRQDARLTQVPVIVVTSSDSVGDLQAIQALGATSYFRKPHDLGQFMRLSDLVKDALKKVE